MSLVEIQNYIGGEFTAASVSFESINPATGEVLARIPRSEESDTARAVESAKSAFPLWSSLSVDERSNWLGKIADRIEAKLEELALDECNDNGKPLWLTKAVDIPRAVSNFRFYSQAITQFASESHAMGEQAINYTLRQPLGVVGCISPWNLPLYLFTWKIAPALAAGNTVVAKPSEVTPLTAFRLSEICAEVGLPEGVLNVVHGYGPEAAAPLCTHSDVKAVSFTGGTKTGASIAAASAPHFKKLSLELGGKNPAIVFADCNYDDTLSGVLRSSFANQGQICLCGSRVYVQKDLYSKFRDDLVERAKGLKVGDPLEKETKQGAVVSEAHQQKILAAIETARSEGGKILVGGNAATVSGRCSGGYFVEPTVIEGLDINCRTNQEEIFGPVITIAPFEDEHEAVSLANGVEYGLASSVWTSDLGVAHRVASKIEAGIVWINCWLLRDLRTPFGGVKNSGVGREGGVEALRFFTEPKNVCVRM